jgi:hypothetical protein
MSKAIKHIHANDFALAVSISDLMSTVHGVGLHLYAVRKRLAPLDAFQHEEVVEPFTFAPGHFSNPLVGARLKCTAALAALREGLSEVEGTLTGEMKDRSEGSLLRAIDEVAQISETCEILEAKVAAGTYNTPFRIRQIILGGAANRLSKAASKAQASCERHATKTAHAHNAPESTDRQDAVRAGVMRNLSHYKVSLVDLAALLASMRDNAAVRMEPFLNHAVARVDEIHAGLRELEQQAYPIPRVSPPTGFSAGDYSRRPSETAARLEAIA